MDVRGMFAPRGPSLSVNQHPAPFGGADGCFADLHSLVVLDHEHCTLAAAAMLATAKKAAMAVC